MRLKNLKVSTRLTLSFGLLLALMGVVAGIGLFNASRLYDGMNEIVEEKLPKIILANDWQANLLKFSHQTRTLVETTDEGIAKRALENITVLRGERGKIIETLQRTLVKPKGIAAMKAIAVHREKVEVLDAELLALVAAGKKDEARALVDKIRPLQQAYLAEVNTLVEINRAVIATSVAESRGTYEFARNTGIALLIVSLVAGLAAAAAMSRSLLRQLGGEPAEAAALAHAVSAGDLTTPVALRPGDTTSLLAQMATMQQKLSDVVSRVRRGADSVATASAEIASGNNDLSTRTEHQAGALEQTAASMAELGSTVRQNADSARQANELALGASGVAVKGGEVVNQVVETMKGINESSRRIADIIGTIDGIAFQTNILALNAAVEAARAGEQGRGFAVVASEVRSLAKRSADAAKEIKSLIAASVDRVGQGTALVDQAGATMTEVVTAIRRVSGIVAEISTASAAQSAGVAQVGEAVSQMDKSTQQNAALVEQSAAAAESLRDQAQSMVGAVAVFKLAGPGA